MFERKREVNVYRLVPVLDNYLITYVSTAWKTIAIVFCNKNDGLMKQRRKLLARKANICYYIFMSKFCKVVKLDKNLKRIFISLSLVS